MTVETQTNIVTYLGDGVTTEFPFNFPVLDETHLGVFVQLISSGAQTAVGFTVTGIGNPEGGSVTLLSAPSNGYRVIIVRIVPLTQELDVLNQGGFYPENVENEFDLQTMGLQQLDEEIGRSLRVPIGDEMVLLPSAADRLGTVFGFSEATGVRELQTYANLATLLAPYMATLLSAINKGDPGGNIMAVGLFLDGDTIDIPVGTDVIRTSGYSENGKGGAFYEYDAAVDAAYVIANPRTAFISSNGRGFRLSLDQQLNVCMFGAVGDDTANDGPAFVEAIAFSEAVGLTGTGFIQPGGPSLRIPLGKYYLGAQTLDIVHTIDIFGEGQAGRTGGASTQLRWDDGVTGIRFQSHDTFGESGSGIQAYGGAANSKLRNLFLKGGYSGTESEHSAVLMRATVSLEDLYIQNWPGDGISIIAIVDGNCNTFSLRRITVQMCRDGIKVDGGNCNGGSAMDIFAFQNRRWGVWDSGFLGNLWHGLSESNGATVGTLPTRVSYNGHWYAVKAGQEVAAATNAPSGDTTDNSWWYYMGIDAGANPGSNVPLWTNGIVTRAGGAFYTDGVAAHHVLLDWYAETAQGPLQLSFPTLVVGGLNYGTGVKGVSSIHHDDFGLFVQNFVVKGTFACGQQLGAAADYNAFVDFTGTLGNLLFRKWNAGLATTRAAIQAHETLGMFLVGNPNVYFSCDGNPCGGFEPGGLNLVSTQGLRVDSTKVVGAQVGPIGDDVSGAPNESIVNAILAALRSHGLIGT